MLYKSQVISGPRGHHLNEDFTPIYTCLQFDSCLKCICLTGAGDASVLPPKCRYVSFINFGIVSGRGSMKRKGSWQTLIKGWEWADFTKEPMYFCFICKLMILNPHNLFEVSSCVFWIRLAISISESFRCVKPAPPPVIVTYFNFPAGLRGGWIQLKSQAVLLAILCGL